MENPEELQAAKNAISETERRLKRAGLSRSYYMQIIKECCEATKSISCISGKDAGGGSVDFVEVPDYRIRLDAVKTIIDLYGDKAPTKQESTSEVNNIHTLSPELQDLFESIYSGGK